MHSQTTLVLALLPSTALSGLPGSTPLFFPRALSPLTPVSSAIAFIRCFIADCRLPLFSAGWPLPLVLTRPNRVRLRYGSRVCSCKAPPAELLPLTLAPATCWTDNWQGELLSVH